MFFVEIFIYIYFDVLWYGLYTQRKSRLPTTEDLPPRSGPGFTHYSYGSSAPYASQMTGYGEELSIPGLTGVSTGPDSYLYGHRSTWNPLPLRTRHRNRQEMVGTTQINPQGLGKGILSIDILPVVVGNRGLFWTILSFFRCIWHIWGYCTDDDPIIISL